MKIQIIRGKDRHTNRLLNGLIICGHQYYLSSSIEEIDRSHYDIIFIDPSFEFALDGYLDADLLLFFDCEDGPDDFTPGAAYYSLKDKIKYYAKMNYYNYHDRPDKTVNIGFPILPYLNLSKLANIDIPEPTERELIPSFIGAPTYIGRYTGTAEERLGDIKAIGYLDGIRIYNQRYQWLLSLREKNMPYVGGIVFSDSHYNLGYEWQKSIFGKGISVLSTNAVYGIDYYRQLVSGRICLCPTGHARNSWRVWDIAAIGGILISTDTQNLKGLINLPKSLVVKDDEDLATILSNTLNYKELWKEHQENKKVLSQLTSENLWKAFTDQFT